MQGRNAITTQSEILGDGQELLLAEAPWYTVQGEGPQAGWPAIFVRLSKCNLRCYFCDTAFETSYAYTLDSVLELILTEASRYQCHLVVITGGEPLLQNVVPLIQRLNRADIMVSIETAGTVYVEGLDQLFYQRPDLLALHWREPNPVNNLLVCSPKTPSIHPRIRPLVGAFKYIIRAGDCDPTDGLPAMGTQRDREGRTPERHVRLFRPSDQNVHYPPIYIQPMDEGNEGANKKNAEVTKTMALAHGYRISVQTHKLLDLR